MANLFGWLLGLLSAALTAALVAHSLGWAADRYTDYTASSPVTICEGWERVRGPN